MSILFFDIDNTLFSHRTFTIPESTHEALVRARANGHHLVLSSGRGRSGMIDFYDEELFEGAVCSSGACVFWHDELICERPIPQAKAEVLFQLAEQHQSGISAQGRLESWLSVEVIDLIRHDEPREEFIRRRHIKLASEHHDEPIYKVDYFFPDTTRAYALMDQLPDGLTVCVFPKEIGRGSGCEISAAGVTKGSGIASLLDWLGMDRKDSYGFGDSENDIDMLKSCGTGIAMGNAVPEIRTAADYITDDVDENGIWNAMKHFGLID